MRNSLTKLLLPVFDVTGFIWRNKKKTFSEYYEDKNNQALQLQEDWLNLIFKILLGVFGEGCPSKLCKTHVPSSIHFGSHDALDWAGVVLRGDRGAWNVLLPTAFPLPQEVLRITPFVTAIPVPQCEIQDHLNSCFGT